MAIRDDFAAGEVLSAADLNDTFASKLDLAGGKILQIVRAIYTGTTSTTSTSYTDVTGATITITPTKTTSAVLILSICNAQATTDFGRLLITDSSNNAISGANEGVFEGPQTMAVVIAYDTPATTSATTYKLRLRTQSGASFQVVGSNGPAQLYAIEVSA